MSARNSRFLAAESALGVILDINVVGRKILVGARKEPWWRMCPNLITRINVLGLRERLYLASACLNDIGVTARHVVRAGSIYHDNELS